MTTPYPDLKSANISIINNNIDSIDTRARNLHRLIGDSSVGLIDYSNSDSYFDFM